MGDNPIDLDACYEMPSASILVVDRATGEEVEIFPASLPRYVFTEVNGPIRPGMVVDHVCGNRRCLNPRHMRLCTMSENARRP